MPRKEDEVVVSIEIAAPPSIVKSFFSDPARFAQWFGGGASLDSGRGGAFRIPYPNGDVATGKLLSAEAERVTFTWGYEGSAHGLAPGASRVEVVLKPTSMGTLVSLTHSGLLQDMQRRSHVAGWRYQLGRLANVSADTYQGPRVDPAIDAYISAWAATDATERARLIESCWDHYGVFKDSLGYAEGREALDSYIANSQRFMPGVKLRRTGGALRSHGNVLFRWDMVTPDGTSVASGWNAGVLNARGQFVQMVGFPASPADGPGQKKPLVVEAEAVAASRR